MVQVQYQTNIKARFHLENFNIGATAKDKLNVCRITLMTCHERRLLLNVIFPKWGHGHQWWQYNHLRRISSKIFHEYYHSKHFIQKKKNKNMWRITLMNCHNRPSTAQCCFLWMRSSASMLKMYNLTSFFKIFLQKK